MKRRLNKIPFGCILRLGLKIYAIINVNVIDVHIIPHTKKVE